MPADFVVAVVGPVAPSGIAASKLIEAVASFDSFASSGIAACFGTGYLTAVDTSFDNYTSSGIVAYWVMETYTII